MKGNIDVEKNIGVISKSFELFCRHLNFQK